MFDYILMLKFDIRKLVNYIVEIRRTPKKLISYFLFGAWISFIILLIIVQVLVITIPAVLIGGSLYWIFRSELAIELGVILANVGIGLLLLGFSNKLFAYIEMKEFSDS